MNKLLNRYTLSCVLPAITPAKWETLYHGIEKALLDSQTFEFIVVGPNFPTPEMQAMPNLKFIRDFGCPSRCFQLGTTIAVGEFITSLTEDARPDPGALGECVEFLAQQKPEDAMSLTHSEGPDYTGTQHLQPHYWRPHTHDAIRFSTVDPNWYMCINPLMRTELYRKMGGIDCAYETVNMNVQDLGFRIQRAGGKMYLSNRRVYALDHNFDAFAGSHAAIQHAYMQVDAPRFRFLYTQHTPPMGPIDYNNWTRTDNIWHRRAEKYA